MRRIISDATAKKCARFCQSAVSLADQSKVRFVDERGRLQDVPRSLAPKSGRRPAAKLLVNHHYQLVTRGKLAVSPGVQQARDIAIRTAQALVRHVIFGSES